MRVALALLALLLALPASGCLSGPAATVAVVPPEPEAFRAEGVAWLPGSTGSERTEVVLPFPVNATGMRIEAALRLASRIVGDVPSLADVRVELRAPDGRVLAEGALRVDAGYETKLEAVADATGEHALVLLAYGGGDGESYGDHVAWTLDVA